MLDELGYTVEMLHDDELVRTFQLVSRYEINTVAKMDAMEYIPGEATYQIFENSEGNFVGAVTYTFEENQATKIK